MEHQYIYEPSRMEILLTELLGRVLMRMYYRKFVSSLGIKEDDRVLDYCSGSGIISMRIADRLGPGKLIYADVSNGWIEHAKNKLKNYTNTEGKFITGFDGLIAGGNYDKIVVHYVLHDFPREYRRLILVQLISSLKRNGILFIREPLSTTHGFRLYELINLIESIGRLSYEYNIVKRSAAGEYVDIRIINE